MSLTINFQDIKFGVGDKVRVYQEFKEAGNKRAQIFAGVVIKIKGEGANKTFTVRKIGVQQVGIERIFPISSPTINKIDIVKKGTSGVRRSKLYYIRKKTRHEIEKIYSR